MSHSLFKYVLAIVACTALQLPAWGQSRERKLYVGKNSTEATMSFQFHVEFLSDSRPSQATIEQKIDDQVLHLFGPMSDAQYKAVPRGEHKFTQIKNLREKSKGVWSAEYSYTGLIVLQNGPESSYTVTLPINPDTIYKACGKRGGLNPCTDSHYNTEDDFWYFWNPNKWGCPLKENIHYQLVQTRIQRKANTSITYPEYRRLVRDEGGVPTITISALLGMEDDKSGRNPLRSGDANASNYREMRRSLMQLGFQGGRPWTRQQLDRYLGVRTQTAQFVEEFVKQTPKAKIVVRMSFGPSGLDEESDAFHWLYRDAVQRSSVMTYDGHSGLGDHLNLIEIEKARGFKIEFDKKNYQLLFFNSCSSYSYYNSQYFARKKSSSDPRGTKNLDILTNGLSTYFSVMHDTNMAVVKAIHNWAMGQNAPSYQALAKAIDSDNLFGVNGDEDNPSTPER